MTSERDSERREVCPLPPGAASSGAYYVSRIDTNFPLLCFARQKHFMINGPLRQHRPPHSPPPRTASVLTRAYLTLFFLSPASSPLDSPVPNPTPGKHLFRIIFRT